MEYGDFITLFAALATLAAAIIALIAAKSALDNKTPDTHERKKYEEG